ncbi:MAG: quinone-interacting membrane-bound oxidoreductase complex subunit QmoC [Proteobacteria bacterium]|nr:quinone-interacting membrane-bound oxidoreductase complex subunit QmoC [Pseudomonadota bacterium]
MKEAGGNTLKQCYQCATCSVACPLSSDTKPFPRKEMILAQWGLKDQLIADPNVYLCHHCGDCIALCPRGARPGDVLGAIRAYVYRSLGWPKGLADLCSKAKNLPVLIGIPAVVIFFMWLISGGMHFPSGEQFAKVGYTHFFGHWDFRLLAKNVLFIDIIMLGSVGIAVFSLYKGASALWNGMTASIGQNEVLYRPSVPQFIKQFLWPAILEILAHKRFRECTINADRVRGHQPLVWAFIGLFFVTCYSLFVQDVLGIFWPSMHGPLSMWGPVKWVANVAAVAMIMGTVILWQNRNKMEAAGTANTFYDWFLIWIIMGVGVTGLAAEVLRLVGVVSLGYIVYYVHLISVMMLFLYLPYTKFAHIVYRTLAMAFERYRESSYVKNPLNG